MSCGLDPPNRLAPHARLDPGAGHEERRTAAAPAHAVAAERAQRDVVRARAERAARLGELGERGERGARLADRAERADELGVQLGVFEPPRPEIRRGAEELVDHARDELGPALVVRTLAARPEHRGERGRVGGRPPRAALDE